MWHSFVLLRGLFPTGLALVAFWGFTSELGFAGVATKAWEQTITLPTYKVAPPDPNPRFYSGRTYQGARATFYPYPVSDQMTERRENQDYKALYLENEYIQMSVLPELGGRIFTALDKGNNYDFFYRQHVIKPALIGMLGAWISGGVEWNIPHHHRASSFMTVDHTIEPHPDGSKTIWVGETELRHRLRWLLGMTVRPDRSYIEMTVKVINRTPAAQSFLFWINPAVHANTNYQVIFPPSTQWAVQHGKPEFASWPIARQTYGGVDYSRGVDISWWKNHPSPVSFFAWHCEEDFFGGYDHGREAGVVQVSNHHVSPGKKFFEWGNGAEGEMWTKILSDEDGPYLELMAGSYSDNQPDYSWIQPGEIKVFKHYWYPVRKLGGIKNANIEAAVDLEIINSRVRVAFNTTGEHKKARALLKNGESVLLERTIRISPNEPFTATVGLPSGTAAESLRASLCSADGREIISYQPARPEPSSMPKPVERPRAPKDISSTEELYLTGMRIEQLYSPSFDPVPYYQEALKRDHGDYRANVALAAFHIRQGRYSDALPLLEAALERATRNYIRPNNCDAAYYLGVTTRALGQPERARKTFYQAIWDRSWQAPGYLALSELATGDGQIDEALRLVDQSLQAGAWNTRALELKVALLRHSRKFEEAELLASALLRVDPLNPRALNEMGLLTRSRGKNANRGLAKLDDLLRREATSYLELAADYAAAGLYQEAAEVLERCVSAHADETNPLVQYHRAHYLRCMGQSEPAAAALRQAATLAPDFCFPFQHESEPILLEAIRLNPKDARAHYYLGNLLFDAQPLRALELWEKAAQLEPGLALAHRNVGFARAQALKDHASAIRAVETALSLDPENARGYFELDVLYEAAGTPVEKRLQSLDRRPEVVARRDDAETRRVALLTCSGKVDEALSVLRKRQFHNWEGSSSLHDIHVDACLQQGLALLRAGKASQALASFLEATQYPANQQVGKPKREQRASEIHYLLAMSQQASGKSDAARAEFELAIRARGGNEGAYFRALALERLGRTQEAEEAFRRLKEQGTGELDRAVEAVDYFAKFGERRAERVRKADAHYLAGLGASGLKQADEAGKHFRAALELHPAHLGARTMLDQLVPR